VCVLSALKPLEYRIHAQKKNSSLFALKKSAEYYYIVLVQVPDACFSQETEVPS
jgi:hypothetical protein